MLSLLYCAVLLTSTSNGLSSRMCHSPFPCFPRPVAWHTYDIHPLYIFRHNIYDCPLKEALRAMRFDDVLDQIGGFGKYQKIQFILAALPAAVIALHQLASVFLAATPEYKYVHCIRVATLQILLLSSRPVFTTIS